MNAKDYNFSAANKELGLSLRMSIAAGDLEFKIDPKNHTSHFERLSYIDFSLAESITDDEREKLIDAWVLGIPLEEPLNYEAAYYSHQVCFYCGDSSFVFDGFTLSAKNECSCENGYVIKIELEVPSGRLYVGNDFRDEFPSEEGDDQDVNKGFGVKKTIEGFVKEKMLHFFVGNSCPGVYRVKDGEDTFLIGNPEVDEDFEPVEGLGKKEASVCTDLWWASIVDGDEGDKRGLEPGYDVDEINVEPGTYVLEYYGLVKSFERYPENGGATIEAKLYRKSETPVATKETPRMTADCSYDEPAFTVYKSKASFSKVAAGALLLALAAGVLAKIKG